MPRRFLDRDWQIAKAHAAGTSYADLGHEHGITRSRVRDIVAREQRIREHREREAKIPGSTEWHYREAVRTGQIPMRWEAVEYVTGALHPWAATERYWREEGRWVSPEQEALDEAKLERDAS